MTTETHLDDASLKVLRALPGQQLRAYGSELEIDEGIAAFGVWLGLDQGWVQLEYEETVVDFAAGFENVESLLKVFPQGGEFPGIESDLHELSGKITQIVRIQDKLTAIDKLEDRVAWDWWRDSGLRFYLDTGQELIIHRAATVGGGVRMRAGASAQIEPDPFPRHSLQTNQKRRYEFDRREVPLD